MPVADFDVVLGLEVHAVYKPDRFVAVEALEPGTLLLVKPGERIPSDALVVEGERWPLVVFGLTSSVIGTAYLSSVAFLPVSVAVETGLSSNGQTAITAFFRPRLRVHLWNCAWNFVSPVRAAPQPATTSATSRNLLAFLICAALLLPAERLLPGQMPAQLHN